MAIVTPVVDGKIPEATKSDSAEKNNSLGYDQFLQLLCAEMQYQDPLEPTSNTEYVAQLATFSQMEATLNMQNTLLTQSANSLVGQYVIVKSNEDGASATAGFVDYVQYENDKQYLYINGNRYSLEDVYQVADPEYMEAVTLAETFKNSVDKLPSKDELTLAYQEDLEMLSAVYNSLNSYQQSYIDADTMNKFKELLAEMEKLKGNVSDPNGEVTDPDGE